MDRFTVQTLAKLNELGNEQLRRGEWEGAAATFAKMLQLDDHPVLRNNLATAFYNGGKPAEAWRVLEPELNKGVLSPFAWALASMIARDLGRSSEARAYLRRAITMFETGAQNPRNLGFEPEAWREYTVIIKRAAGHLDDHRLVIDLHQRWERFYQTPEDLFQVGVAFFNLHYLEEAAEVWSQVKDLGWGFLEAYITVAELVDQGVIPGFPLPYTAPDLLTGAKPAPEKIEQALSHGGNRTLFLASLFKPDLSAKLAQETVSLLVRLGEWGIAFGKSILVSRVVPKEWKFAAGRALLDLGVLKPGEPVPMIVDGRETEVTFSKQELGPASPEEKEVLEEVQSLLKSGRCEEARDLLVEKHRAGGLSLEGFQLLAKAHGALGEREHALAIVRLFIELGEDGNAWAYLVAAELYLYLGERELASQHLTRVAYQELSPGARESYARLREYLGDAERRE